MVGNQTYTSMTCNFKSQKKLEDIEKKRLKEAECLPAEIIGL